MSEKPQPDSLEKDYMDIPKGPPKAGFFGAMRSAYKSARENLGPFIQSENNPSGPIPADQGKQLIRKAVEPALDLYKEGEVKRQILEKIREELHHHKQVVAGHEELLVNQDEHIEKLGTEARTDVLTGIENRFAFMEDFKRAIEITRETGGSFYFLQYDINDLKLANTLGGHPHGDTLIRTAAQTVNASMRETDSSSQPNRPGLKNEAARTGGDEIEGLLYVSTPEELQAWFTRAQERYNSTKAITPNDKNPEHPIEQQLSLGLGAVKFDPKEYEGKSVDEIYKSLKDRSELPLEVAKKVAKDPKSGTKNAMFTPEQIEQDRYLTSIADSIEEEKKKQAEAGMDSRKEAEEMVKAIKTNGLSLEELHVALEIYKRMQSGEIINNAPNPLAQEEKVA